MNDRVTMVTGTTNGIGRATAEALARAGATVVCVNRDRARGEQHVAELKARTGNPNVELGVCDLASFQSIRDFAREFRRTHPRLHVLVDNAGAINQEHRKTKDGFEATFGVNHLGTFLLTHELLPLLKASAPARIIVLASEAERMGHLDFEDLMFERRPFSTWASYAQSKLANVVFTYELAARLEGTGVTVNAVHPGGVATNFGGDSKGFMAAAIKVWKVFAMSPEKGAETSVYLATSPEVEGVSGKYWAKKKPLRSNKESYDRAVQQRLWAISEKLTGVAGSGEAAA